MPGREVKRGAIMFTDILGYRNLAQANESHALDLLGKQRDLLFRISAEHGGQGSKPTPGRDAQLGLKGWLRGAGPKEKQSGTTSYSILVFDNPVNAVRCAISFQKSLLEQNRRLPKDMELLVGIGIDVGEFELRGEEVYGEALGLVSRIWDLAGPGGICITNAVAEKVQGDLKEELVRLTDEAKGLHKGHELYKVSMQKETGQELHREPSKNRIAVLPFSSLSPDPNDEYFSDGMTEEVISTISKISEIEVISRTSVMLYKKTPKPIKELSKELDVGTVLEGSVRKAGNKLRVTVQMIDALKDRHLWANSYDREIQDVFAIQTDIAERVADALKLQLVSKERQRIEKKPTESSEAYSLYLKGRYYWNERTEKGLKEAIKQFEAAIRIDRLFAKAYSGLADCYMVLTDRGLIPPKQALPLAKKYAERALELDQELAEVHASLGGVSKSSFSFATAERQFRRAIELNPNYAMAYHWLSVLWAEQRKYEEAYEMEKVAYKLDPHLFILNLSMGLRMLELGKTDQAIEQFEKAQTLSQEPTSGPYFFKSMALASIGKYPEAIQEAKKAVEVEGPSSYAGLNLAWLHAAAGQPLEATEILSKALSEADRAYMSPGQVGLVKLGLGEKDEGFRWLKRAYDEHDGFVLYFRGFPWLRKYWSDPRWIEIETKAGIAQHY